MPSRAHGVALALLLSTSAVAGKVEVGSFTKTTGAAPVTQVVPHQLGEVPRALIIWSAGATASTATSGVVFSLGLSDGTTSTAVGGLSETGQTTTSSARRYALKAVSLLATTTAIAAEADLTSWTSTSLTFRWTTNDAQPTLVHYLLISGADVQAKLVTWAMAETPQVVTVSGVGFQPELLINVSTGSTTATAPRIAPSPHASLSMVTAAGDQASTGVWIPDGVGAATSNQSHHQQWGQAVTMDQGGSFYKQGNWLAMTADGFRVNFTIASAGAGPVYSLALRGLPAQLSRVTKRTGAPPVDSVVALGYQPAAVFVSTTQDIARDGSASNASWSIGASDFVHDAAFALLDLQGASPTAALARSTTTSATVKVTAPTGAIDATANALRDDAGFRLRWNRNDAVATELLALALGVFDAGQPDAGQPDSGQPDAGQPDAGRPDAGSPDAGVDAGQPDAGSPDAGPFDAGTADSGMPDAGALDAGPPDGGEMTTEHLTLQRSVGCACDTTSLQGLVAVLLWVTTRRRR